MKYLYVMKYIYVMKNICMRVYTYVNIYITIKKKLQRFLTCQSLNSRIDFGSKIQEDKILIDSSNAVLGLYGFSLKRQMSKVAHWEM